MQYRKLGKTGFEVSILGYGGMRFPIIDKAYADINKPLAIKYIRQAIDAGINFIDTAYPYHGGNSEVVIGEALKDGYREKVYLMDKSPIWEIESDDDFDKYLDEQLTRLDVDTIDIYLFHGITREDYTDKIVKFGLYDRALRAVEAGKIRKIGWSYHGKIEDLKEIIDAGIGEIALLQYNLLDRTTEEMMSYAVEQGMGVIVMGPVGGGRLASPPPDIIDKIQNEGREPLSAEMALRFVWSNPNVSIALSGMGTPEMLESNLELASVFEPFSISEREHADAVIESYKEIKDLYCTDCKYCLPCPSEVNIPLIFSLMNYYKVHHVYDYAKNWYKAIGNVPFIEGKPASECTECGECEPKCPQNIPIIEQLKETAQILGKPE